MFHADTTTGVDLYELGSLWQLVVFLHQMFKQMGLQESIYERCKQTYSATLTISTESILL